ncbi:hypothetical protein [Rhodopila sp.]|jgi:hypothetical protein|uniref:hypothetical protein n=1 Tax=Rhodopila sp. TaxID=2480087 RepID=UPI002B5B1208|nr:hypothetical protein [Rhodopila sp.]HVZ06578.1 hypothetical protein [Rhodopila sp.]
MSDLLALRDEREFTAFLCGTLGAKLLLSDLTKDGEPHLACEPLAALPSALPGPAAFGDRAVRDLIFWLPLAGPLQMLADAPMPATPVDVVARRLSNEAAGDRTRDLIDLERSPILIFRRSQALSPQRLAPGGFGSRPLRVAAAAVPAEIRAAYRKAHLWLRARAVKTDPFDHCPEVQHRRPKNLGPLCCWVQPEAWRMVQFGMEIWPWNG